MQKLIVMSNAYEQSSVSNDESAKIDPRNRLLWHFPRQRLEGEVIRDSALAAAGLLNASGGGPSVYPGLPPGLGKAPGGWKTSNNPAAANPPSIYIFVPRNARYPILEEIDTAHTR